MNVVFAILQNVLAEGLTYGVMALGVYITYKVLDFPDLSVDGTFPLGCCVTAVLLLAGLPPVLVLACSFVIGCLAGSVTGLLHVKLGISDLLSGIIVMTALWTVNLVITSGSAVVTFFQTKTIFPITLPYATLGLLFAIVLSLKLALDFFFRTRAGLLLKSTGDNSAFVTGLGRDPGKMKILGLALGNGFTALSGSLLSQQTGTANVSSGTGMVVMALAAVIIGASLFGRLPFVRSTTAVLLGMVIYRSCLAFALQLELFPPNYLKLLMSVIFTVALVLSKQRERASKEVYPNASKL
jgi:ABC-type uncharacterized transport system, permease component